MQIKKQNWPKSTIPLVSISCITYNHENYIRDCIEGFLMQETNFRVEILIHDDASIDKTANIIREYEKKYPNIIFPIYQKVNQKSKGKRPAFNNYNRARGKYIAICEGDDYWTNPFKIQKQVDFLESNMDCMICYTRAKLIKENGEEYGETIPNRKKIKKFSYFEDQLRRNLVPNLTCVFRAGYLRKMPKFYFKHWCGDWLMHLFNSQYGKLGFIDEITAAYRKHDKGISKSIAKIDKIKNTIETYYSLNSYYKLKYKKIIKKMISKQYSLLSKEYAIQKEKRKSIHYFLKSIELSPLNKYAILHQANFFLALVYPNLLNYKKKKRVGD